MIDLFNSVPFWCLAIIGVIFTGISKSGFAGGAGVVAVPLMALVIPVPQAAILMLPLLIVMDAKTIQYYREHVSWAEIRAIVPASLIGIIVGGLVLGLLSPFYLQVGLGVLSITFALWHRLAPVLGKMKGAGILWGSLSGFTSTLIHAGGPPINIYLIAKELPKTVWLATAGVFFGIMNVTKIIPYTLSGQWSLDLLWISGILVPVALLGTWLGKRIQKGMTEKTFMSICRMMLLISGAMLIVKSAI